MTIAAFFHYISSLPNTLYMKKNYIILPFVVLLGYVLLTSYAGGPAVSPGVLERTGASGTTGCTIGGCHGNSVGILLNIELLSSGSPVSTYTPGGSYTIRMTGSYSAASTTVLLPKFGFQLSCVKTSTTTNAGTWGTPPASCHTATASGISLVEHGASLSATTGGGSPGSTYVVDMPWTAPVAGTGSVTIFGVLNAVNGNTGADAVDRWKNSTFTVTEATGPTAPITGIFTLCVGDTTTLADATAGGTWSSGTPGVATVVSSTGFVTAVAPGTATINYTVGASTPATQVITVNAMPTAITGTPTVCISATTTLSSTPAGGTWNSSATAIATVGASSGIVSGVAAGTADITYTVGGCRAKRNVTVNATGAGTISGSHTVCVSLTTTLSNPTLGGTWSSSAPTKATVGATSGIVTGVSAGTAMISYAATNACGTATTTHSVNVVPLSSCPTGIAPTTSVQDEMVLFPNPSTGIFTLEMRSAVQETVRVTITNITGEKVQEMSIHTNAATEIRLPYAATGMYFVVVNTTQGRVISKLLVQ